MTRTFLAFLLGAWLALTVAMGFVAGSNFRIVEPDTLRDSDEIYAALEEGDERRMALRYVASEINRDLFARYDVAGSVVAGACLVLLLRLDRRPRGALLALGLCLALTLVSLLWTTPTVAEMGRAIDFVPRDPPPPEVEDFYSLHGLVVGGELVKVVLLALVTTGLARETRERGQG